MGIPLTTDGMPQALRGTVIAYRKTAATVGAPQGKTITYGPFSMSRAPMRADVALGQGGPAIDADEVWFFIPGTNIEFNDVVRRIETQQQWTVVDVKAMPSRLLIYVKRMGAAVPGNK